MVCVSIIYIPSFIPHDYGNIVFRHVDAYAHEQLNIFVTDPAKALHFRDKVFLLRGIHQGPLVYHHSPVPISTVEKHKMNTTFIDFL